MGKRRKKRLAQFGIDLVRDLLEVGIFSFRRQQLATRRARGWAGVAPPWLFLSERRNGHLGSGSIGDLMKGAFNADPPIPGSGHRLRAFYATMTAIRIFGECLALTGDVVTMATVETAFERVADALGHSRMSTTVRFYLDIARLHHTQANPERDGMLHTVWAELGQARGRLSASKISALRKVIAALLDAEEGSDLCRVIELAAEKGELIPSL